MDYLNVWFSNKPIEKVRRPSMQHSSATDSYTKWESRQRSSIRRPSYEVAAGEFHSGYGKFKPPAQMGSPGGCSTISSIVEDNMGNDFLDFIHQGEKLNIPDGQAHMHIKTLHNWLETWIMKNHFLETMYYNYQ